MTNEVHEFRGHRFIVTRRNENIYEVALEGVKDIWTCGTEEQQLVLWQCALGVVTRHSCWPDRKMPISLTPPFSPDGLLFKPMD